MYAGRHASSFVVSNRTAQPNSNNSNTLSPIESEALVREFSVDVFFKHNADLDYDEINFGTESKARCTFYIAEEKLQECPRITIKIGEEEDWAILDTGCELTLLNENLYEKIKQSENRYLELPAQQITLVSAFNDKSRRVKRQIFYACFAATTNFIHPLNRFFLLILPQSEIFRRDAPPLK